MKNNKGITLVALVITIIVLLILAGVTIASLSGDNGILTRGKQAKIDNEIGNTKDLINLAINEGTTEFYNDKYASSSSTIGQKTLGGYLAVTYLKGEKSTAKSVIASIAPAAEDIDIDNAKAAKYTITTTAKNENGKPLLGTMDANGKITWSYAL